MNVLSLFDGISCGQLALQRAGIEIKNYFASEIDKHAIQVTQYHFPNTIQLGSVVGLDTSTLPKIDLLIGGSPCQSFSMVGKRRGFDDTRGTLFFEIARIIKSKRPKAFLLENVKNLMSHDKGKTFKTILKVLEDLDYKVFYQVVSSESYVPQKRERIYIVGFDKKQVKNINFGL